MIYKQKFEFNGKVFDNGNYDEESGLTPPYYHGMTSCAIGMISLKNYHTINEIEEVINHIKKDSNSKFFKPSERNFGEQSVLCVISPGEQELENNLKKLKFKLVGDSLKRRRGYPPGLLKLYLLTF